MLIFIVSCGKQTAPALELQDTDSAKISSDVERVELPNPQEATFAAETEVIEESNPTETPEHGPATDVDKDKIIVSEKPKKEIKVESFACRLDKAIENNWWHFWMSIKKKKDPSLVWVTGEGKLPPFAFL